MLLVNIRNWENILLTFICLRQAATVWLNSISLTHWSVDSEALVFSLLKHKYPVSLDRTSQMVYPLELHVGLFVFLFILIILVMNLEKVMSI